MSLNTFPSINPNALHAYGQVRRTHGHQGHLVINVLSNDLYELDPEFLFIVIDEIPVPFEVEEMRGSREQLIIALKQINSLEEAERLIGSKVLIHEEELSESTDIHHQSDLVGFQLFHPTLQKIGTVIHLDESTANQLLTIEQTDGDDVIIPLVEDWIMNIDPKARKLTLNFPEELLHL